MHPQILESGTIYPSSENNPNATPPGPNAAYNPPPMNPNSIPNQPGNSFSDPNSPLPNFNGNTTVDTASLAAFGNWVATELTEALQALKPQLQTVQVEPGAFYWADYIRSYINGTGGSTGLSYQMTKVLEDLIDGLTGIKSGVDDLVQKYTSTEDMNSADATKLESDMTNSFGTATGYFNALLSNSQTPTGGTGG